MARGLLARMEEEEEEQEEEALYLRGALALFQLLQRLFNLLPSYPRMSPRRLSSRLRGGGGGVGWDIHNRYGIAKEGDSFQQQTRISRLQLLVNPRPAL